MNGDWEPMWVGPPAQRLYAAFHPALGHPSVGVVLAPPLLHELPRSRRFIMEIAAELAEHGLPCLRFDYYGTGDSGGTGDGMDFSTMRRDLGIAVSALKQRTPVRRVCLLAWRGSALALCGWANENDASDLLVLCDPILDGAGWLRRLIHTDARERLLRPPLRKGVPRITDQGDGQLMGFAASPSLRADIEVAHLNRVGVGQRRVWAMVRDEQETRLMSVDRAIVLPADTPCFNDDAAMDSTFFLTPRTRDVVGELGSAIQQEMRA